MEIDEVCPVVLAPNYPALSLAIETKKAYKKSPSRLGKYNAPSKRSGTMKEQLPARPHALIDGTSLTDMDAK